MKWKNRLTNYNFWISIVSAVLLIFQAFKIKFDLDCISEIVTALLGLLVVIGIISDPTKVSVSEDQVKKPTDDKKEVEEPKKETVKEVVEEINNKKEEVSIPSVKQDENCADLCKDDIKVVVDKISKDLEENIKILEQVVPNVEAVAEVVAPVEEVAPVQEILDGQVKIEEVEIAPIEEIVPANVPEILVEEPKIEEVVAEQPIEEIENKNIIENAENKVEEIPSTCHSIVG